MGPRSTSRSISGEDALVVGHIRGPHGVRGEVRIDPRSDVPGRFRKGAVFACDGVGDLTVASVRGDAKGPIVRFDGYATRADAETLRDRSLRVPRSESRRAAKGAYLWADLVGLRVVTPEGGPLGTVREVIRAGENDVLVIDDGARERLLPLLESVGRAIEVAEGRIVAVPQEEAG